MMTRYDVPERQLSTDSASVQALTKGLVKEGLVRSFRGATYVWSREEGQWSYVYSFLTARNLADKVGGKMASVNYRNALAPFVHYLTQFAIEVPVSSLNWTICVCGHRFRIEVDGKAPYPSRVARVHLRPMGPVLDPRTMPTTMVAHCLAFPFGGLPCRRITTSTTVVDMARLRSPDGFACSLFRARPGNQVLLTLWELGRMLTESPVRARCSLWFGPGGTGKSHSIESVFTVVLGRSLFAPLRHDYWCCQHTNPDPDDVDALQACWGLYIADSSVGVPVGDGAPRYNPAVMKKVTGGDAIPDVSGSVRVEVPVITVCNGLPDHTEFPETVDEPMMRRTLVSHWYRLDIMREAKDFVAPDPTPTDVADLTMLAAGVLRTYGNAPPIFGWDLMLTLFGMDCHRISGIRIACDPELDCYDESDERSGDYEALVAVSICTRITEAVILERARCVSRYSVTRANDWPRQYLRASTWTVATRGCPTGWQPDYGASSWSATCTSGMTAAICGTETAHWTPTHLTATAYTKTSVVPDGHPWHTKVPHTPSAL